MNDSSWLEGLHQGARVRCISDPTHMQSPMGSPVFDIDEKGVLWYDGFTAVSWQPRCAV